MNIIDPPVAVRRIDTNRADAYAFEVAGQLSTSDIQNLHGLLEGAYQLHDKIDLLIRIADHEGFSWSTALRESTLFGRTRTLRHLRRYALVGGPGWMAAMIGFFHPFSSVEVRHFDSSEEADAWDWIGASEIPENI